MNAPKLAIGDGAMGVPVGARPGLSEGSAPALPGAQDRQCAGRHAEGHPSQGEVGTAADLDGGDPGPGRPGLRPFPARCQEKYPKAAVKLIHDRKERMNFFDFPAEHWQSIRATNPIESTFATIRHRTRGCLSRDTMLAMMFRLGQCAESRWRRLRGFRRLGQVIEGVPFQDGIEVQSDTSTVAAG